MVIRIDNADFLNEQKDKLKCLRTRLNLNQIDEWKKYGLFAHLKSQIADNPKLKYYACINFTKNNQVWCDFWFLFDDDKVAAQVGYMLQRLHHHHEKLDLQNCSSTQYMPSVNLAVLSKSKYSFNNSCNILKPRK